MWASVFHSACAQVVPGETGEHHRHVFFVTGGAPLHIRFDTSVESRGDVGQSGARAHSLWLNDIGGHDQLLHLGPRDAFGVVGTPFIRDTDQNGVASVHWVVFEEINEFEAIVQLEGELETDFRQRHTEPSSWGAPPSLNTSIIHCPMPSRVSNSN